MIAAVAIAVAAVLIALFFSRVSAADVAREVAPEVTAAQIADSRGQRVKNARAVLDAANRALVARGLPVVADPGPGAKAEQISTAASTAQVLGLIPEDVAQLLRQDNPGPVVVLPTADGTVTPPASPGPSSSGSPGSSSPGSSGGGSGGQDRGNPAGAPDSGNGAPANPSTPAPARPRPAAPGPAAPAPVQPAAPERRLLPQLLPFPFPLVGD